MVFWRKLFLILASASIVSFMLLIALSTLMKPPVVVMDNPSSEPSDVTTEKQPSTEQGFSDAELESFSQNAHRYFWAVNNMPEPPYPPGICEFPVFESPHEKYADEALILSPPKLDALVPDSFYETIDHQLKISSVLPRANVPKIPASATKSGHCIVSYFVNKQSRAENIMIENCSDPIFEKPTIQMIADNIHPPYIPDKNFSGRQVNEQKVSFRIMDEDGNIIPE